MQAALSVRTRCFYRRGSELTLQSHKGSSVVIAGDHQPPAVHALAHAINQALGNVGKTVFYTEPVDANPVNRGESLHALVEDMRAGKVDLLLILGGNPAYDAPAELEFASALKSNAVNLKVFLGSHRNETAELCQWHVPEAHYLESWSDARAYDGTVSIVQPLDRAALRRQDRARNRHDSRRTVRPYRDTILFRPTGRSSTLARTSTLSGASRCMTAGSRARPTRRKMWR